MALIRFLICFLFFLVFPTAPVWSEVDIGTLKKGVVKITAQFANRQKIGTGFVAGQGKKHVFIVTASHVIEGEAEVPQSINVTFFSHQEEPLVAEVINKEGGDPRGLALLKVGGDLPDDVQILEWDTQSQLHGGEEVRVIGFPQVGGNPWAVTRGTLSGFDGPILKFSGAVEEGNSGGPLLYQGKVIGVIVEIIRQFGNAKPSQIAQFTVENWPGFSRQVRIEPKNISPGSEPDAVDSAGKRLAALVVTTVPKDAEVFVDDELVGNTTQGSVVVSQLIPDAYEVAVKKKGYRPWFKNVELLPGERREVKATLQEGAVFDVTGVWKNPNEPTVSYVLQQIGDRVVMREVTASVLGTMVTAEGEGQLQGNQLAIFYRTVLGTMGQSSTTMSDDGRTLTGTFQDFSNMIPMALSLVRTADSPAAFGLPGNDAWKAIQGFGQ
ncbi:MAG: trypsin-like peptidase domain-containing protein [Nitrospirota bacterium]|nr:trypsin-like peptidase domain-containing protein [Nitrospirota bacterium]MDH5698890.1 trypsin-like peptidase domain-containing protein [Nitrospirota bacterium]